MGKEENCNCSENKALVAKETVGFPDVGGRLKDIRDWAKREELTLTKGVSSKME